MRKRGTRTGSEARQLPVRLEKQENKPYRKKEKDKKPKTKC